MHENTPPPSAGPGIGDPLGSSATSSLPSPGSAGISAETGDTVDDGWPREWSGAQATRPLSGGAGTKLDWIPMCCRGAQGQPALAAGWDDVN